MSRLHVVHRTTFRYAESVPASFNEARISPVTEPRQTVLAHSVGLDPVTWRFDYVDYWGTRVTAFEVLREHGSLAVTGTSLVDVQPAPAAPSSTWATLRAPALVDALTEELSLTDRTRPGPELTDLARRVAGRREDAGVAALDICRLVTSAVEYEFGVTEVHTTAVEAWEQGSGVCQDFAHLCVGALRSVGIPARYVSGYLHPQPGAAFGESVAGESHAWVEWWAGGWFGWDPTNDAPAGELHVVVGRGREYTDVVPLKGIVAHDAPVDLLVEVEVTRQA